MTTYFNIMGGPLRGFRFKPKSGITLGGEGSHINLKEDSISGLAARISSDENQQLFLSAESSDVSIYVNDNRIKKILIANGQKIKIGSTLIYVVIKKSAQIEPEELHRDKWPDIIKKKYTESLQLNKEMPIQLSIMNPMVNLHFVSGLQIQTDWTLGYGPRIVGPISSDLKIFEPGAPEICFELIPSKEGILFQTDHKKTVLINQKNLKSKILENGDLIKIYDTEVLISLLQ